MDHVSGVRIHSASQFVAYGAAVLAGVHNVMPDRSIYGLYVSVSDSNNSDTRQHKSQRLLILVNPLILSAPS